MKCTASGQQRSWSRDDWGAEDGSAACPDCGGAVVVWVRANDLFPHAKARAHSAPPGVIPSPYGHHEPAGVSVDYEPHLVESIQRGLADSAAGRTVDLGDFTQYADDPDDDPEPVVWQLNLVEFLTLTADLSTAARSMRVLVDSDGVRFSLDGGRWSPPMGVRQ